MFLLPSETESFGLAALEAIASGVPVVASRVGGLPEVVRDGEVGFLHAVGDVEAMAAAARRLFDDAALHARLGAAARARSPRPTTASSPRSIATSAIYRRAMGPSALARESA